MDGIRQWAFSACAAIVACAAAMAIMPEGGLQKVFSITVSVFFLCCLLSPVIIANPGLAVEIREVTAEDIERMAELLMEITAAQSEEAAASEIEKIIARKLDEMGINYIEIAINISTNIPAGDGAGDLSAAGTAVFEVESADITLTAEHEGKHDSIRKELEESLGFKVRLGYLNLSQGMDDQNAGAK